MPETDDATLAGIVAYHPDIAELARLVAAVAPEVRAVAVFANSALDAAAEARLREAAGATALDVMRPAANAGLGAAHNALGAHATERGCTSLFILDQDSLPEPGTITRLRAAHAALRRAGERPAAIGPRPVTPEGRAMKVAAGEAGRVPGLRPAGFIIASGTLVPCEALARVGPFRADYFIDAIDLEWCMRARARGLSVWIDEGARMTHRLGRGIIRLPLGIHLTDQPPFRLYTYLRNQVSMLRLPHVPRRHKARFLMALPLRLGVYLGRHRFRPAVRLAIGRGLLDGWQDRLGPPPADLARRLRDGV